jgi:GH25 family lysozyme M1 (1,4-beta-N-acetylmuramidase)
VAGQAVAEWLEPDDVFEGVGAHRLNPRYDDVDGRSPEVDDGAPVTERLQLIFGMARALQRVAPPRLDGIDTSHYQWDAGPVNLATVRSIPTNWYACKGTQSLSYVDPTMARSVALAESAGFRHRLIYGWISGTTDPVAQARFYTRTVGALIPGWGPMLDAEEKGTTEAKCLAWCETVEDALFQMTGIPRPVTVYTGLYTAGSTIWRSRALRQSRFGPRPFIVAAYVSESNLNTRVAAVGGGMAWQAWQFSSNGPVPGITGRCDMNRVDDVAAFDRACGLAAADSPVPTPVPQPTPGPVAPVEGETPFVRNAGTGQFWQWGTGWFPRSDGSGEWEWTSWASPVGELGLRWEEIGPLVDALGGLKDVPHDALQSIYDRHGRPPVRRP